MNLKFQYLIATVAFVFFLTLTLERPAYGYTDPGSAILIYQGVTAAFTGALFYFRRRLKGMMSTLKGTAGTSK